MAEHLTPSDDFSAIVDDFVRRLRAVEREGRLNGFQADLLQTFENGQLLGDTKYINFGAGVRATLTGDRYVEITADAGGGTSYDAIVDGTLAASDPTSRLFLGIGEALTYLLNIVGLASCIVGVRPEGTSGYVEPANWDSPADVRLIGLRGISEGAGGGSDTREVDWDWNGFRPTSRTNLYVENFHQLDVGAYTSPGGGLAPLTSLEMFETDYNAPDSYTSGVALCSSFVGYNSTFDFALASPATYRLSSGPCVMVQCDGDVRGAAHTFIPAGAASSLLMVANRWKGSTWTLPAAFDIELLPTLGFRGTVPGTPGGAGTFVVPAASTGRIVSHANALITATADFNQLVLEGQFATLTATGAHEVLSIQGENGSATFGGKVWTIKGPADIDCVTRDAGRYVFQGEGVGGVIAADGLTGTTTFLDFVAADRCSLVIAADPGSGPRKAYAFDASSDLNLLMFLGHDTGWTAGTDASGTNVVGPPWVGAAAVLVGVEDEGVAQGNAGTFDFVGAGVTAAEAGGVATITIPGGASFVSQAKWFTD